jgi:nucleoid-associated protein YgaU
MLRCLIFIITALLLSSCAKPPHQELDAAEYMVGRAYAKQATEFAPAEYQAARTALDDARDLMKASDYGEARDSLELALQHARRAVVFAEEGKEARRLEEEQQRAKAEEEKEVHQATHENQKEKKPVVKKEKPSPQPKPVAKPKPKPKPKPKLKPKLKPKPKPKVLPANDYSVGSGETLWTISAQPEVYGEGLLWPLLYQANRDQIKDPRQIFPGQSLSIRRDMTEADLEDARQKARESDIFPVSSSNQLKQ